MLSSRSLTQTWNGQAMPERAQSFEDHYRTQDNQVLFFFRFRCDAGSSTWRFAVKYGDLRMTYAPSSFHDSGLVLCGETREELLDEAARWSECIHAFYASVPAKNQKARAGSLELTDADR